MSVPAKPYIEPFFRSGYSFEDRAGDPEAFDAAIGLVAVGFSFVEDRLSVIIGRLLKIKAAEATAVTAEMSFRNKVHLFASLVRIQLRDERFNIGTMDPESYLRELAAACFRVEELRNSVMHSSWGREGIYTAQTRRRTKITAKAARGIYTREEVLSAGEVLDVYDYAIYIGTEIDEFMLTYGETVPPHGSPSENGVN